MSPASLPSSNRTTSATSLPPTSPAWPRAPFPTVRQSRRSPPNRRPKEGETRAAAKACRDPAASRESTTAQAIGTADQHRRRRRHRHARRQVLAAEAGFLRPADCSSRPPTTATLSPMRSRCWPAATIWSVCAAAAPRHGRSRSSSGSSATHRSATAPRSAPCRQSSRRRRPSWTTSPAKIRRTHRRPSLRSRQRRSRSFAPTWCKPAASCATCRRRLRSDIGRLKAGLEFLDIALIPIIVAALAIILGALRLKRRSRRAAEA